VRIGSKHEINVENILRGDVLHQIDNIGTDSVVPIQVFDILYKLVYRELKEDGFPYVSVA
jgi:hypothetical protein